jgi:hypothetical protein
VHDVDSPPALAFGALCSGAPSQFELTPREVVNNTLHDGARCHAAVTWSTRYVDTLGRERPHRSVPRGVRMELVGEAWCSAFTSGRVVMYTVGGSLVDAACGPAVARGEKP